MREPLTRGSRKAARGNTVAEADSWNATTAANGSSTAASRSATTTLTASIIVIGYSSMACGCGIGGPTITPITTVGGCAARPSSRGARIGGGAITTAWAIINLTQLQKRPGC